MKHHKLAGGILLLALSVTLAMPAQAQHHGPPAGPGAGVQQRMPQGMPAQGLPQVHQSQGFQNYDPRGFTIPRVGTPRVDPPRVDPRVTAGQFDQRRGFDNRQLEQSWVNGRNRFDGQRDWQNRGRLPVVGGTPDYRRSPDWARNGGDRRFNDQWRQPIPYRGHERFNGPGFLDPYNHIREGRGFFQWRDDRFFHNQFENRFGAGWYGRTNGEWARHRVNRSYWPWAPGIGIAIGIGYYNGWGYNGIDISYGRGGYYALDGFCPTEYIYMVGSGRYWRPTIGAEGWYGSQLPSGYGAPITVAVTEVVPVTDEDGYDYGYERHVFYYNAFWDANSGLYGYYDYRGDFHWLN